MKCYREDCDLEYGHAEPHAQAVVEPTQLDRIESKLDKLLGTEIGIHDNMGATLAERSAEATKDL